MKAVIYEGCNSVFLRDIPDLGRPNKSWARVRVCSSGLCGSDLQKITQANLPPGYLKTNILGHEISGVILEPASQNSQFRPGDRVCIEPIVACGECHYCKTGMKQHCVFGKAIGRDLPGGFCECIWVPETCLYRLPDSVSFAAGCLVDIVAVALYGIRQGMDAGDLGSIAIIGDGPLGLMCIQVAKALGAIEVLLVGKRSARMSVANELGALTLDTKDRAAIIEHGNSCSVAIEAAGGSQSASLEDCLSLLVPRGTVVVLGVFAFGYVGHFNLRSAFCKESRIIGANSYGGWGDQGDFYAALKMIADRKINPEKVISHSLPLDHFDQGVRIAKSGDGVKVVFEP